MKPRKRKSVIFAEALQAFVIRISNRTPAPHPGPKAEDLRFRKYGRLTVLGEVPERRGGKVFHNCLCDCGNTLDVMAQKLTSHRTKSCGCLAAENLASLAAARRGKPRAWAVTPRSASKPATVPWPAADKYMLSLLSGPAGRIMRHNPEA